MRWLVAACVTAGCVHRRPAEAPAQAPAETPISDAAFGYFLDETEIELLSARLAQAHAQPATLAITHATVVSLAHPGADLDQTIVIDGGTITALGPAATTAVPSGATVIDGRGRYVMPGLVDMHVHTELSTSNYLLDLANGVTHASTRGDLDRALDALEQLRARCYPLRERFLGELRGQLERARIPTARALFAGIPSLDIEAP